MYPNERMFHAVLALWILLSAVRKGVRELEASSIPPGGRVNVPCAFA